MHQFIGFNVLSSNHTVLFSVSHIRRLTATYERFITSANVKRCSIKIVSGNQRYTTGVSPADCAGNSAVRKHVALVRVSVVDAGASLKP